jgi:hypothetical protein
MLMKIRCLSNSKRVPIRHPLLQQGGSVDRAESRVGNDAPVLRQPKAAPRAGWASASRELSATGDDALVLSEFANEDDASLTCTAAVSVKNSTCSSDTRSVELW